MTARDPEQHHLRPIGVDHHPQYIGFSGRTFVNSGGEVYEPMGQLGWLMRFEALESADRVAAPTHSRVATRTYDGTLHIYEKAPLEVGQAVAQ